MKLIILPSVFFGLVLPAQGAQEILSLKDVLETARLKNPEISAARSKWMAARAKAGLESGYDRTSVFYETMYKGRERVVGIAQDIPFPGKLSFRGAVARREASMLEQASKAKETDVIARTKSAFAMLFLAHKSIEIYKQNVDLMRQFAKVAESKYSVGKASQVDVLKAQVELSRMLNMLVTLEREKETAQAMLNILLNQDPEQPLGIPEEPHLRDLNLDYRRLSQAALLNRPELLEAHHHVRHSKAALRSARFDYLPDFMIQLRRRSADDPEMDGSNEFMVGAKLPLWFGSARSAASQAKFDANVGEAEYQAERNMTLWKIKDLLVKVQAAERLVNLYRTSVIPQAENALRVSRAAYQSDRASFLDLIDIQRNWVQFRLEHYQHLADYERLLAELEQVVGMPLMEVAK